MTLRLIALTAALAIGAAQAAAAAPALDAQGKCRDNGKYVDAAKCKPVAKQTCKDAKGRFVKCTAKGAVPIKK
jgi:hypothetical protein